jgi:hypothetical protein
MNVKESNCCENCKKLEERVKLLENQIKILSDNAYMCDKYNCMKNIKCIICKDPGCHQCLKKSNPPKRYYGFYNRWYLCEDCEHVDPDSISNEYRIWEQNL